MNQVLKDLKLLCSLPDSDGQTVSLRKEQAANIAKALEEIEEWEKHHVIVLEALEFYANNDLSRLKIV